MDIRKYIEQFLIAGLIGGMSMGVKYLSRMSDNVEQMTIAVQLLAEKISNVDKVSQDHEARLRHLESRKK